MKVGRITGDSPAKLSFILPPYCDGNYCGDLKPAYVLPGQIVAIGQSERGFVCAHYSNGDARLEENGWLAAGRVKIINPETTATPLSAWRGTWRGTAEGAAITILPEGSELHARFETTYEYADRQIVDCMDGTAIAKRGVITFGGLSNHASCGIRLTLIGRLMAVTATNDCTASGNLRYGSFYIRQRETKPVSGRC
ncbi:MAG TPA: hypothetical protein VGM42_14715 [Rhodopila sp.]